jgi:hypothetical protein
MVEGMLAEPWHLVGHQESGCETSLSFSPSPFASPENQHPRRTKAPRPHSGLSRVSKGD